MLAKSSSNRAIYSQQSLGDQVLLLHNWNAAAAGQKLKVWHICGVAALVLCLHGTCCECGRGQGFHSRVLQAQGHRECPQGLPDSLTVSTLLVLSHGETRRGCVGDYAYSNMQSRWRQQHTWSSLSRPLRGLINQEKLRNFRFGQTAKRTTNSIHSIGCQECKDSTVTPWLDCSNFLSQIVVHSFSAHRWRCASQPQR